MKGIAKRVEQASRNTMTIGADEHRTRSEALVESLERASVERWTLCEPVARVRTARGASMLGLRRSFVAAAEQELLILLNHRLSGAGVNHGARNP